MSLILPTSPVYGTSAEHKRHAQAAAKKRTTPKILRDVLREKCRIRMREARQNNFQRGRRLLDAISENEHQQMFSTILRQEVAELEKDLALQEEIFEELRREWQNLAGQFEEEENYLIEVGENDVLICPVCQKSGLEFIQSEYRYSCACGTSFLFSGSIAQLRTALESKVEEHGIYCPQNLFFYTEPNQIVMSACKNVNGGYILNGMCDNCDYFFSF